MAANQDDSRNRIKVVVPGNQDYSSGIQDDSNLKSTRIQLDTPPVPVPVPVPVPTPQPPTGAAGGVVVNDSAETNRVCQWANDLVMGWGPLAEGACVAYPASWVREACSIAHEAKYSRFKAVESILGRFKTQGGPDSAQAKGNGRPPPEPVARLPEPDPAAVERAKRANAKAMAEAKARREA